MSGLKTSLAAFALLTMGNCWAFAQEPVPGGWSTQFGYQSLGSASFQPGVGFGSATGLGGVAGEGYGFGYAGYPMTGGPTGYAAIPGSLNSPITQTGNFDGRFLGFSSGRPQTSMSTDPLIGVISKSVRRSKRH